MTMREPIVAMAILAAAHRAALLATLAFGTDPNGARISAAPGLTLLWSVALQIPFLLLPAFPLVWLARRVPRAAKAVAAGAALLYAGTLAVGVVDTGLVRYLGLRLTPSQVVTYGGATLNSWELIAALKPDAVFWIFTLGITVVALGALVIAVARPVLPAPRLRVLLVAVPLALPAVALDGVQLPLHAPAEALLLPGLARRSVDAPADPAAAMAALRAGVEEGGTVAWAGPTGLERLAPRRHLPPLPDDSLPDILIWSVESLRGAEVGFAARDGRASSTPVMDALAGQGIALPRFIANGFPNARGFLALHTGLWPQMDRVTISSHPDLRVDALAERLGRRGYRRAAFWGTNPDFDNQLAWGRRWFDDLRYESPGNQLMYTRRVGDGEIADRVLDLVGRHDGSGDGRPLLIYVSTAGTHYPFTFEDSYYAPLSALGDQSRVTTGSETDPLVRYRATLANMDRQLGRVVEALRARPRGARVVIVVSGDHAFPVGESVAGTLRSQPVDDYVWTSALIAGPASLLGPPRRLEVPATQTDLLPTLLDLIRDPDPYVAMGHSLLGDVSADRVVLSLREGGLRVESDSWSLYVPVAGEPWADRAMDGRMDPVAPARGGFEESDARRWRERVATWSWLVDRNLVKAPGR